jgi:hypothetical protein
LAPHWSCYRRRYFRSTTRCGVVEEQLIFVRDSFRCSFFHPHLELLDLFVPAGKAKRGGRGGKGRGPFVPAWGLEATVPMDFFKIKKFGKGKKSPRGKGEVVESEDDANAGNVAPEEEQKDGNTPEAVEAGGGGNGAVGEGGEEEEEDDDDDLITNEVRRRLKEMRNSSFMVLIPEEECAEVEEDVEEEEGSSSREWVEPDAVDGFPLCRFYSLYEKYCQRMLVFDKMILQLMKDPGKRHAQFVYYCFFSYMRL